MGLSELRRYHISCDFVVRIFVFGWVSLVAFLWGCRGLSGSRGNGHVSAGGFSSGASFSDSLFEANVGRLRKWTRVGPSGAGPVLSGLHPHPDLPLARSPVFLAGSWAVVRSHDPMTANTAVPRGHCQSDVRNLVVSRSHLYYVLHQWCATADGTITDDGMSVRSACPSNTNPGSDPTSGDESTVISYWWPYNEPNGTRVAEASRKFTRSSMAYVTGAAMSRRGSHLVLSVRSGDGRSMITSLSLADGSRSSVPLNFSVGSLAMDYTRTRVYLSVVGSGDAVLSVPVSEFGLPLEEPKHVVDYHSKLNVNATGVQFQYESLVSDSSSSCLCHLTKLPQRARFGARVFAIDTHVKSSLSTLVADFSSGRDPDHQSFVVRFPFPAAILATTADGCHLFATGQRGTVFGLTLGSSCAEAAVDMEPVLEYKRAAFRGLALHEDHDEVRLFLGASDGNLFQARIYTGRLWSCKSESRRLQYFPGSDPFRQEKEKWDAEARRLDSVEPNPPLANHDLGNQHRPVPSQPTALDSWGLDTSRVKSFPLKDLTDCTHGFSDVCRVGAEGAFGKVYRGSLQGAEVAIKLMIGELTDAKRKQFISEVNALSGLNHANLISLVGYCVEGGHCVLVYPFFGGGSLHDRLFLKPSSEPGADPPPEEPPRAFRPLTLQERMSIIFQVAKGLCYLHYAARPPIIHRDIKSNNILLGTGSGERLHTVVADFGLASIGERVLGTARELVVLTSHIGGTFGYMSPEYMLKGELSDKNDVYSFGVLLLEVLTGTKVLAPATSGVGWQTLVEWVRPFLQDGDDPGPVVRVRRAACSVWRPSASSYVKSVSAGSASAAPTCVVAADGPTIVGMGMLKLASSRSSLVSSTFPPQESVAMRGNMPCSNVSLRPPLRGVQTSETAFSIHARHGLPTMVGSTFYHAAPGAEADQSLGMEDAFMGEAGTGTEADIAGTQRRRACDMSTGKEDPQVPGAGGNAGDSGDTLALLRLLFEDDAEQQQGSGREKLRTKRERYEWVVLKLVEQGFPKREHDEAANRFYSVLDNAKKIRDFQKRSRERIFWNMERAERREEGLPLVFEQATFDALQWKLKKSDGLCEGMVDSVHRLARAASAVTDDDEGGAASEGHAGYRWKVESDSDESSKMRRHSGGRAGGRSSLEFEQPEPSRKGAALADMATVIVEANELQAEKIAGSFAHVMDGLNKTFADGNTKLLQYFSMLATTMGGRSESSSSRSQTRVHSDADEANAKNE
ncbi:hypothetical protein CBR_g57544 [Chara braunii]|uniref:Protein kinase domain-containing protein n=1 Tax=Chara braunii TaxID=69332 RepID=A0A388ME80_CHABU|nr:hypothetical protein CBR_g57544 [Chara braunii]|eukprot:GBG92864.1 hypothetical protein CBR_g57544 [Chara braunii]